VSTSTFEKGIAKAVDVEKSNGIPVSTSEMSISPPESGLVVEDTELGDLCPEDDEGAVEYKWCLSNPSADRFAQLVTQLNFRLMEGHGECLYELGVEDCGRKRGLNEEKMSASLRTLQKMASQLGAETQVLTEGAGREGKVAQVLVRRVPGSLEEYLDLRVCVAGNVDSGKSTLVGVLTGNGELDNGRGKSRQLVMSHKHELESGRTSKVAIEVLGFSAAGNIVNYSGLRPLSWSDVVQRSAKLVTFYDLAGHERYLKTTMFGMTAHVADYCMLVVGANMGVLRMTKEHLCIALALRMPVFVVITKVDLAPEHIKEQTITHLQKLLKSPSAKKIPVIVRDEETLAMCAQNIVNDRIVPFFVISNVTGEGLGYLRSFLNIIQPRKDWTEFKSQPAEFSIDEIFTVPGVGTVVAGTTVSGSVSAGQVLALGPDSSGHFTKVQVKSVHYKRTPVKKVVAGQAGSLALKKVKRPMIRKGMVLLDSLITPGSVREFTAEVLIFYHGTTIKQNYQPIIHCETVRQAAKVLSIDKNVVRTGDRAHIHFRFMYHPEYVKEGSRFIFREGRTKGIGKILNIITRT